MKKQLLSILVVLLTISTLSFAQITSSTSGNWSLGSTWVGGVVPSAASNVVVAEGHTVTIDPAAAVCNNLTINGAGTLQFRNDGTAAGITVNGDLIVSGNTAAAGVPGKFLSDSTSSTTFTTHTLTLFGNLSVTAGVDASGILVFRMGTNSVTAAGVNVTFEGATNSVITLQKTVYSPETELFNAVTIQKTGGAKIVLSGGNLFQNNNSSTGSSYLYFRGGIIQTGENNFWVNLTSASAASDGASATSYVDGNLGRGISSGGGNRIFDVGDANGFRPLKVYPVVKAYTSKNYMVVRCVAGDANTGASTLSNDIDKVSSVRYYKATYYQCISSTPETSFWKVYPYYGTDDGVAEGNTNLDVAYSGDNRATWTGTSASHTTSLTSPPTEIRSGDMTAAGLSVTDGDKWIYFALARKTGTTENSLGTGTSVEKVEGLPTSFELSQNYPNPFNPTTFISFSIPQSAFVTLKVYDVIGKEVANLVSEQKDAGNYKVNFDASKFSSGVYIYRLSTPYSSISRKMMLLK